MASETVRPGPIARQLIDRFQRDLPLLPRPYAAMAAELGTTEADVLAALDELDSLGVLARVGATVRPHRAGWSTLAAMAVPEARLEAVAALVSSYAEVNHNYEREHHFNLWFVVTAPSSQRVEAVLAEIEARTGIAVLDLPLERAFKLDLGFPVPWSRAPWT